MKYITFKERESLIESWADNSFPHTWRCPKHNCLVRVGNRCPECFAEESLKRQGEEVVRRGLFGKMNKELVGSPEEVKKIKEALKEKNKRWNKMNSELKKKRIKIDNEYRLRHNELNREYMKRKKTRKIEHSI